MAAYFSPSDTYHWLDPTPIYESISDAAGSMSAIMPMLITIVFGFRYFQEASQQLTGKARFNEAAGAVVQSMILLLFYSISGFLLLEFAMALAGYFYSFGSFSLIAGVFNDLYVALKAKTDNYELDAIESLLDAVMSVGAAPLSFLFFQTMSMFLTVMLSFLRVGYAMYFGLIYLWGFIAIPSGGLSGALDLSKGWTRSMIALVIWPVIEAILLIFMYAMMKGISAKILTLSGTPSSIYITMHFLMGLVCLLLMVVMVAAPFVTARLAMSQEALSGLMKPVIAGALVAGHYANQIYNKSPSNPQSGGDRHRDKAASTLQNVNKNTISSASQFVGKSVKGLGNAITNSLNKDKDK